MSEAVDIEALQAQIDLSNSVTYDLVSSWMKRGSEGFPTSVSSSIARDLEEYAKRPPRLGLGASVSKANAATAHEAAKLKRKLAGTKRAHDQGASEASTSTAGQAQEEDDGESRSAAISTKKVKVNGTGGLALGLPTKDKGKGRAPPGEDTTPARGTVVPKTQRQEEVTTADGTNRSAFASTSKPNPFVMPKTTSPVNSSSPLRIIAPAESPSTPPKKKKKKKHKRHKKPSKDSIPGGEEDEEWLGFSIDADELLNLNHIS